MKPFESGGCIAPGGIIGLGGKSLTPSGGPCICGSGRGPKDPRGGGGPISRAAGEFITGVPGNDGGPLATGITNPSTPTAGDDVLGPLFNIALE